MFFKSKVQRPDIKVGEQKTGNKKLMAMLTLLMCASAGIFIATQAIKNFGEEKEISWHQKVHTFKQAQELSYSLDYSSGLYHAPADLAFFNLNCRPWGEKHCVFLKKEAGEESLLSFSEKEYAQHRGL